MSDFQRYAVYYLPDDPALAAFGAQWLGWDVVAGRGAEQPDVEGIAEATQTPRKYGFHGTIKPPFFLAPGKDAAALQADVAALAAQLAPVTLEGMELAALGRFLALVPRGDASALGALAFRFVEALDPYRRPPDTAELERRRAANLSPRQEALLDQWGYPYVGDEFRFHLTLSGKLSKPELRILRAAITERLPKLDTPFTIRSMALVGQDRAGMFHLIQRYALT